VACSLLAAFSGVNADVSARGPCLKKGSAHAMALRSLPRLGSRGHLQPRAQPKAAETSTATQHSPPPKVPQPTPSATVGASLVFALVGASVTGTLARTCALKLCKKRIIRTACRDLGGVRYHCAGGGRSSKPSRSSCKRPTDSSALSAAASARSSLTRTTVTTLQTLGATAAVFPR